MVSTEVKSCDFVVLGSGWKESIIASFLAYKTYSVIHVKAVHVKDDGCYDSDDVISPEMGKNLKDYFDGKRLQSEDPIGAPVKAVEDNIFLEFMKRSNALYNEFEDLRKWFEHSQLVKLFHIDWHKVEGQLFRDSNKDGKLFPISVDADELLNNDIMGMLEKRRYLAFRDYCVEYRQNDKDTWKDFDCTQPENSSEELYNDFGFDDYAREYNGQAVGRLSNEAYLPQPSYRLVRRVQLCHNNLAGYAYHPYFFPIQSVRIGNEPKTVVELINTYNKSRDNKRCGVEECIVTKHDSIEMADVKGNDQKNTGKTCMVKIAQETIACNGIISHPAFLKHNQQPKCIGWIFRKVVVCKVCKILRTKKEEEDFFFALQVRLPFKQIERNKMKHGDVCFTFLHPALLFGKPYSGDEYVLLIETALEKSEAITEMTPELKESMNDILKNASDKIPSLFENIEDSWDRWPITVTQLFSDTIPDLPYKAIITDNTQMIQPLEVICGEVVDMVNTNKISDMCKAKKNLLYDRDIVAATANL